jgi:hypothetical protein
MACTLFCPPLPVIVEGQSATRLTTLNVIPDLLAALQFQELEFVHPAVKRSTHRALTKPWAKLLYRFGTTVTAYPRCTQNDAKFRVRSEDLFKGASPISVPQR